jgi:hypothetical protein
MRRRTPLFTLPRIRTPQVRPKTARCCREGALGATRFEIYIQPRISAIFLLSLFGMCRFVVADCVKKVFDSSNESRCGIGLEARRTMLHLCSVLSVLLFFLGYTEGTCLPSIDALLSEGACIDTRICCIQSGIVRTDIFVPPEKHRAFAYTWTSESASNP